jgi:hypothetical protein
VAGLLSTPHTNTRDKKALRYIAVCIGYNLGAEKNFKGNVEGKIL